MFKNVTKEDLCTVLQEIGKEADLSVKVAELKDLLLKSKEYVSDKESVTEFLSTTVTERKNAEEVNKLCLQQ